MSAAELPDPDAAYKEAIENLPAVSQRELAKALLIHKVLGERMKSARATSAEALLAGAEPGDRSAVKLPDGELLGAVTVANGRRSPRVVDQEKLTAWVAEHCPTEVEVVYETRIRQAFQTVLLAAVVDHGGWLDPATGEVQDVPGVEVNAGDPYLVVKPVTGADQLVERAWRSGDVDIRAVLQIGGPDA